MVLWTYFGSKLNADATEIKCQLRRNPCVHFWMGARFKTKSYEQFGTIHGTIPKDGISPERSNPNGP